MRESDRELEDATARSITQTAMRTRSDRIRTRAMIDSLTPNQEKVLSAECMKNARSLFRAGELLGESARDLGKQEFFAYGTALMCLAHEEAIKGMIYALVSSGIAKISKTPVKGALAIHPSQLTCHACKQEIAAWNAVTGFVEKTRLGENPTLEERESLHRAILESPIPPGKDGSLLGMGVRPEHFAQVRQHLDLVGSLWGLKETCLYVDSYGNEVQSPTGFPPPLFDLIREVVRPTVVPSHPFETAEVSKIADAARRQLPPNEVYPPIRCHHKKARRVRGMLTIELTIDPSTK